MSDETVKETKQEKKTAKPPKIKTAKETDKLRNKLKAVEKEKLELKDKLLRTAAEFDNFKKRNDRERLQLIYTATEGLVTELLNVLDDMERSLDHLDEKNDFESLKNGLELIYKNFNKILEKQGLKAMQSVGEPFDPEKHDALMQTEKKGVESGIILDEHKKGYCLNDKIIRHAQVIVAK